jgi:hypothetical protein
MSKHLTVALLAGFFLAACADDETTPGVETDAGEDVGGDDTGAGDVSDDDTATEDTIEPTDNGVTPDTTMPDVAMEDTTVVPDVMEPTDIMVEDTATDTAGPDTVETDTVAPTGAVLTGVVSRSGDPASDGDGIGDLYIAVLDGNPLAGFGGGGATPNAVGVQLIENADLSLTSTQIEYRIEGIPPRAEAYFISAFLDDDDNAEPGAGAQPDRGDLLNLESLLPPAIPSLVMDSATEFLYDIDLNQTRPF